MRALCAMFLLLGAFPARADDLRLARELFVKGKAELDSGRSGEALTDLQAAYAAKPAPSLFFYLGEAHYKAGHSAEALGYYQRYLAALPDGPMQKAAAARIGELQPAHKNRTLDLEAIDLKRPARPARPAKVSRKATKAAARAARARALPLPLPPGAELPLPTAALPEAELPLPTAALPEAELPLPTAALPAAAALPADALPTAAVLPTTDVSPAAAALPTADARAQPAPVASDPLAAAPAEVWTVRPDLPPSRPPAREPPLAGRASFPVAEPAPRPQHPQAAAALERTSFARADSAMNYVSYTARLLVPGGSFMLNYATTASPAHGTLYTHGLAVGRQSEYFRNAVYLGFGTEIGGPAETLQRYEVSWQCIWSALGSSALFSPYLGFRLGGMMVKSELLTGGSLKPGVVGAALGGVALQLRHFVLNAGLGYDENLGPSLSRSDASISGYSFDLGATVRF